LDVMSAMGRPERSRWTGLSCSLWPWRWQDSWDSLEWQSCCSSLSCAGAWCVISDLGVFCHRARFSLMGGAGKAIRIASRIPVKNRFAAWYFISEDFPNGIELPGVQRPFGEKRPYWSLLVENIWPQSHWNVSMSPLDSPSGGCSLPTSRITSGQHGHGNALIFHC